jgi:hypothetical protein
MKDERSSFLNVHILIKNAIVRDTGQYMCKPSSPLHLLKLKKCIIFEQKQVELIGLILPYWDIVCYGSFLKITQVAQPIGLFFHGKSYVLISIINWAGLHFVPFFDKLIHLTMNTDVHIRY